MSANNSGKALPPFGKKNFAFVLIGMLLIAIGYFIMGGEEFKDATEFSMSLHVVPFILLAGFIAVGYGIMVKPDAAAATQEAADTNSQKQ